MTMSDSALQDVRMKSDQSPPPVPDDSNEPKFGGFTRFEIELEVCLEVISLRCHCGCGIKHSDSSCQSL
jgi:hypothetical protein